MSPDHGGALHDALHDGLHADALATLDTWPPPSPAQAALRDRFVAHLREHPGGMRRACLPAHVTASTLVLDRSRRRVLLTLHAKSGRWFQLGGHAEDGDATLAGAALREAVEESGLSAEELDLDPVPVLLDEHVVPFCGPAGTPEPTRHLDVVHVALVDDDARHAASEESLDVAWWPVEDLPNPELVPFLELAGARVSR